LKYLWLTPGNLRVNVSVAKTENPKPEMKSGVGPVQSFALAKASMHSRPGQPDLPWTFASSAKPAAFQMDVPNRSFALNIVTNNNRAAGKPNEGAGADLVCGVLKLFYLFQMFRA